MAAVQLFLNSLGIVQLFLTVRRIPELEGQPVSLHGLAVLVDVETLDPALKIIDLLVDPRTLSHHGQVLRGQPATKICEILILIG